MPAPVGDERVDEPGDHDGVDDVGDKVASLGQWTRDERRSSRSEHELKEPLGQLVGFKEGGRKEIYLTYKIQRLKNN